MAGMDLQIAEFRALRDAGALGAVSAVGIPGGYVIEVVANNGRRRLLLSRRRGRHFVFLGAFPPFLPAGGISFIWTLSRASCALKALSAGRCTETTGRPPRP